MNSTLNFLASFGGAVLIRALWPEKQRPNQQPEPIRVIPGGWIRHGAAYSWYGLPEAFGQSDAWDFAHQLNALGYGLYFAVNDPHGPQTKADSVRRMRAIYQDDDEGWLGSLEVAGAMPHWTIRSSPGKTSRRTGSALDPAPGCRLMMHLRPPAPGSRLDRREPSSDDPP